MHKWQCAQHIYLFPRTITLLQNQLLNMELRLFIYYVAIKSNNNICVLLSCADHIPAMRGKIRLRSITPLI